MANERDEAYLNQRRGRGMYSGHPKGLGVVDPLRYLILGGNPLGIAVATTLHSQGIPFQYIEAKEVQRTYSDRNLLGKRWSSFMVPVIPDVSLFYYGRELRNRIRTLLPIQEEIGREVSLKVMEGGENIFHVMGGEIEVVCCVLSHMAARRHYGLGSMADIPALYERFLAKHEMKVNLKEIIKLVREEVLPEVATMEDSPLPSSPLYRYLPDITKDLVWSYVLDEWGLHFGLPGNELTLFHWSAPSPFGSGTFVAQKGINVLWLELEVALKEHAKSWVPHHPGFRVHRIDRDVQTVSVRYGTDSSLGSLYHCDRVICTLGIDELEGAFGEFFGSMVESIQSSVRIPACRFLTDTVVYLVFETCFWDLQVDFFGVIEPNNPFLYFWNGARYYSGSPAIVGICAANIPPESISIPFAVDTFLTLACDGNRKEGEKEFSAGEVISTSRLVMPLGETLSPIPLALGMLVPPLQARHLSALTCTDTFALADKIVRACMSTTPS